MDREHQMQSSLEEIRQLLSHLHGEVTALESSYSQVLSVLRKFEGVANTDDLTGLLRRRAFFQTWNALLDQCEQLNDSCGVLMIDIDHFKRINDTHGHATGDEVIRRVADLLKQYESPNCVVSRLGGEEFAVAMRGSDAELLGVAEFIRRGAERLHGPVVTENGAPTSVEWKCTLSVGMASARSAGYDSQRQLQQADEALYEAKTKGRNQVRSVA
jgi:diguanylate cyclase (GGDEF)-like protein